MQINKISNVLKSRCGVWTHPAAVPALLGCYWDVNSAVVPLVTVRRRLKKPLPFSIPEKVSLPVSFDLFNFRPLKAPKEVQQKSSTVYFSSGDSVEVSILLHSAGSEMTAWKLGGQWSAGGSWTTCMSKRPAQRDALATLALHQDSAHLLHLNFIYRFCTKPFVDPHLSLHRFLVSFKPTTSIKILPILLINSFFKRSDINVLNTVRI